jgi:hypothetical protein
MIANTNSLNINRPTAKIKLITNVAVNLLNINIRGSIITMFTRYLRIKYTLSILYEDFLKK